MFGSSWPDPFGPTVFGHCSSSTTDGNLQMNIHRAIAPTLLALATSAHADTSPFIGTWSGWWNERAEVELAVHSVDGDGTVRGSYCVRHPRALVMPICTPIPAGAACKPKPKLGRFARDRQRIQMRSPSALSAAPARSNSAIGAGSSDPLSLRFMDRIARQLDAVEGMRTRLRGPVRLRGVGDETRCSVPRPTPCRAEESNPRALLAVPGPARAPASRAPGGKSNPASGTSAKRREDDEKRQEKTERLPWSVHRTTRRKATTEDALRTSRICVSERTTRAALHPSPDQARAPSPRSAACLRTRT